MSPLPQPEHEVEALARRNGLHPVREVAPVDHGEAGALRTTSLRVKSGPSEQKCRRA